MAFQIAKSKRRAATTAARGDAPNTGMPKTPAPTAASIMLAKDKSYGRENLGSNAYGGKVYADPGQTTTIPLGDEMRAKAESEADQGAHLSDVIQHGTARNNSVDLASPQTRDYSLDQKVGTTFGMRRQTAQSSKPGDVQVGTLPATCGASAAPDPTDPNA